MRAEYHIALWLAIFVFAFIVGYSHGLSEGATTDGRENPLRSHRTVDEADKARPLAESNVYPIFNRGRKPW